MAKSPAERLSMIASFLEGIAAEVRNLPAAMMPMPNPAPAPEPPDEILTEEEAAGVFKIAARTLRRKRIEGDPQVLACLIPSPGEYARYSRSRIMASIQERAGRTPRIGRSAV